MRRELRAGQLRRRSTSTSRPAPLISWDASTFRGAPVVGTFHAYATKAVPNHIATPARRAPHLQPALGPDRRLRARRSGPAAAGSAASYTIVPNGVDVEAACTGPKAPADDLRLLFVGRAEERKGLPVLLSAFEALLEHVPARLTVVGADPEEVERGSRRPRGR